LFLKKGNRLSAVAQTYNLSYLGGRYWEDCIAPDQLRQKVHKTYLNQYSWAWCQAPIIPASMEVQASLGIKQDPTSKITKAQGAGGVAQLIEPMSREPRGLTSTPSITKNKNKTKKQREKQNKTFQLLE
jgi:hypothetical protein